MGFKLFDYQIVMKNSIIEAFGVKNAVMCQMPTGTGKTHVLAAVVDEYARSNGNCVWMIAHRKELVSQIQRTWNKFYSQRKDAPRVRVMSIQWLTSNWQDVATEHPCLIVIDEAHHALAETYQELWRRRPDAKKLGMTATPYRMTGASFTDLFDTLLTSNTIQQFILMKRLSLFDYYAIPKDSKIRRQIAMMKRRGPDGDYQTKEMATTLNTPRHIEYLYNSLQRYAKGRRGIVYAINIEHARAIADFYAAKGLNCCAIDCKTPVREREAKVEAFRNGEIDIIVNVDIFSEGFDCPEVQFIQLARPTLSLAVYLQQVGRGLRKSKWKRKCVILDNSGLSHVFGSPIRDWNWKGMFMGRLKSVRLDEENSNQLLRHLGYPGRLEDEPMELLISNDEMNEAIKNQGILVHKKNANMVGVKLKGRIVATLPADRVLACKNDIAAVLLRDGSKVLVLAEGRVMEMPQSLKDFYRMPDGMLRLKLQDGIRYIDLLANRDYDGEVRVVRIGAIEMIEHKNSLRPRFGNWFAGFRALDVSEANWHGFYFKAKQEKLRTTPIFYIQTMTQRYSWESSSIDTVLLPGDLHSYQFVCELPDGSIVIVSDSGEYFRVQSDSTMIHLFSAGNYLDSKEKFTRWLAKHEHKFLTNK